MRWPTMKKRSRTTRNRDELRGRLDVARTHLDVARRFADQSYLASLDRLTQQQALELYSEVLLKIDTYHVNEPSWKHLVYRGVVNLDIAATEPAFVDRFPASRGGRLLAGVRAAKSKPPSNINAIENRDQAVDAVAAAARHRGPASGGVPAGRDPGIHLCRRVVAGPVLGLPDRQPIGRSVLADRGELRRAWASN